MKAYHFTNSKFEKFSNNFLGTATIERGSDDDDFMAVSTFGFCFVSEEDIDSISDIWGDDFGSHIAECEIDINENNNFDSCYADLHRWIESDGVDAVMDQMKEDGCEYINLWNGDFNEILVLDCSNISITGWVR